MNVHGKGDYLMRSEVSQTLHLTPEQRLVSY